MCGLNGFNFKNKDLICSMNNALSHRGPDDSGVFVSDFMSLGHTRLSIMDLSKAATQPMSSVDGNLILVFNGEIYNFLELKKELQAYYHFKTSGDSEVILAAYSKWGRECVQKFNGIFALAIWDKNKQELFLARDHLGVKPLYYYHDGDKFIFASEIKAIFKHDINKVLDKKALNIYFRLLYVPEPLTPWQNIFKLPPAHYLVLKNNQIATTKYWCLQHFDNLRSQTEAISAVREQFIKSVRAQLMSDRPLGLYLSGGIDSTALLGVMSILGQKPVQTFSIGFDVSEQTDKYNADFILANKTAKHFKSDHHEVVLRAIDVKETMNKIVWHMDDLASNHTQTPMFMLSSFAKKEVDVVLSGDGGDELFAGYDRYYLNYILDKFQRLPESLRKNFLVKDFFTFFHKNEFYQKINTPLGCARWLAFMSQKESMVKNFLQPDFNQPNTTFDFLQQKFFNKQFDYKYMSSTKALQYLDIQTWLLDDALNRADRMSMANGLEQRVPFLDKDLVALAMAIPSEFNIKNKYQGKEVFKKAMRDYVPDYIYNEPKRGFFSPMAKWLRADLKNWAYEILSPDYNDNVEYFLNFQEIKTILDKHMNGEHYALNTIWSLITFQIWYKLFSK